MKLNNILLAFVTAFWVFGSTFTPVTQAVTLDQMIKQSKGGPGVPDKVLRYEQGKAESGFGGDIYRDKSDDALSYIGLFNKIIDNLAIMIAAIAIAFIVINGLRITYSAGGEELNKAKTALLWSALGLGMITFGYIITKTVISLTYIK